MEYSSRMKDYYDLYYLLTHFEFEDNILADAIKITFLNRNHHFTIEQFGRVMSFGNDDAMRKKWNAFLRKTKLEPIDYDTVINTINQHLSVVIDVVIKGLE